MFSHAEKQALHEFKAYVIDPLSSKIETFEQELRVELRSFRDEFRQSLEQNAALIRSISDPMTGYVPRAEIMLARENFEKEVKEFRRDVDSRFKDFSTDVDERIKRTADQYKMVGSVVGAVFAGIITLFTYLRGH